MNKKGKIGVFDSGIGGVTVLREMIKVLPEENYSYYTVSYTHLRAHETF